MMKKLLVFLLALALFMPAALAEVAYPIVTEPVTLTYWVQLNASASKYIQNLNENTAYQQYEKDTGVHIDFQHPATGQEQEQFNLMIVSGDLPDIIGGAQRYVGGEFQGYYDGWFRNLRDMLPDLAPDYWSLIEADAELYREVATSEGEIVAFYRVKPLGDPPHRRIVLRQDVLDELGMEIPHMVSDLEALFDKMLEAGITPYMLASNGYEEQYSGLFNVINGWMKDVDSGKAVYGQIQPGFKDYLALMNAWYEKGYISRDFTSADGNTTNTLFDTKQIGTYMGPIVATYNRGQTQGFDVVSAPYLRFEEGQTLHYENTDPWPRNIIADSDVAVVSTQCKSPEIAVQWLNYAYTEKGSDLMNWGVEGINYEVVNGEKVYNDLMLNNPNFGTEEASHIYKVHFAPKLCLPDTVCHANLLKSPGALASRMAWADADYIDQSMRLPPFQLSSDALTTRTSIMSEINTYVDEMTLKFIMGVEPLENFDQFVATVTAMGIEEATALTQEAYDAYLLKVLTD